MLLIVITRLPPSLFLPNIAVVSCTHPSSSSSPFSSTPAVHPPFFMALAKGEKREERGCSNLPGKKKRTVHPSVCHRENRTKREEKDAFVIPLFKPPSSISAVEEEGRFLPPFSRLGLNAVARACQTLLPTRLLKSLGSSGVEEIRTNERETEEEI